MSKTEIHITLTLLSLSITALEKTHQNTLLEGLFLSDLSLSVLSCTEWKVTSYDGKIWVVTYNLPTRKMEQLKFKVLSKDIPSIITFAVVAVYQDTRGTN